MHFFEVFINQATMPNLHLDGEAELVMLITTVIISVLLRVELLKALFQVKLVGFRLAFL